MMHALGGTEMLKTSIPHALVLGRRQAESIVNINSCTFDTHAAFISNMLHR